MTVLVQASSHVPHPPTHLQLLSGVSLTTQRQETEKYGYGSHGAQNQELLCWRRPAAIYPKIKTDQLAVAVSG
jgi:hypothetical protein